MSIKRKVAFIELHAFQGVYPLASGYLQAVACQNPQVMEHFAFEAHSLCINDVTFEDKLNEMNADVYAFSCYVWNMGFIKRWLPILLEKQHNAQVILGGPQVMNKADRYLSPHHENVVLCNGEGEHTFVNYLIQLCSGKPDFQQINGLSFYQDNILLTNPKQDRIKDLNEIPSPYLQGFFNSQEYVWALIETNRGCPFKCTYCFWGAATNAKVYKTDLERVKAEITWLSKNRAIYLFIADANFGMLHRDVEIAQHIAECKEKNGYPMTVYFSSSKNTPERVTEITKILSKAGLVATQPISMQTMDAKTLESVKRDNIKQSSYTRLQEELNRSKLSSFMEMIWPLPGETLSSFKNGLGQLCRAGADSFIIYPLLLINNVEMDNQRAEFEFQVSEDADPNSEAQIVIGTRDVSNDDYQEGVRFSYHVTSLHSLRGLKYTGRYLDSSGIVSFTQLISAFTDFCHHVNNEPYIDYIEDTIAVSGQSKYSSVGGILHVALHENRAEFDELLLNFMNSLYLLNDDYVRFLFELDLLNRPYVYSNTPISNGQGIIENISIVSQEAGCYTVKIPHKYQELTRNLLGFEKEETVDHLKIKYRTTQMPYMKGKSYDDNFSYCQDKLHKMTSILPVWSVM
ncbi:MAG: radical SAM protein [SAR324 cluster bacterium]|nr:radical SAM protein [SAR324 cluster bacterium]